MVSKTSMLLQCMQGFDAVEGEACPFIPTSSYWLAWKAGRAIKARWQIPPSACWPARGQAVNVRYAGGNDMVYRVEKAGGIFARKDGSPV